jgi:GNAT superfamily N-acetyltransferase
MEIDELLTLYDRYQRFEMEWPDMQRELAGNVVRVIPRPEIETFYGERNSFIQYSRLTEQDADAVIQEQIRHFTALKRKFNWELHGHDQPADLRTRLERCGFAQDEDASAVMVLELSQAPQTLLAPVQADLRLVNSPEQIAAVAAIMAQVWGGNFDWLAKRLWGHLQIPGVLRVYLAYHQGQPAGTGWVYLHPHNPFASLWGGSTLAEQRGKGLYRAMLQARVQAALDRGYRFLAIDAGPMSGPIVEKYGFRQITTAQDFAWKPPAGPEVV